MTRKYERVYRQRILQAEHDGNVFATVTALAGVFVGFGFALPFYF